MKKSIKRQLLLWLLIPLVSLALLSSLASYSLCHGVARNIYDDQLVNSADSVAARIRIADGRLTIDLPPEVRAILRHDNKDEFFYEVLSPAGIFIAGDKFLSQPIPISEVSSTPAFRIETIQGKELRLVAYTVPTPNYVYPYIILQSAETRNSRTGLASQMTVSIFLGQLLMIILGAIAIRIGIGRGLMPLARVEKAVSSRSPGDFSPFDVDEPVEVNSMVSALNKLLAQLNNDIELQRRFIANAAHQLRTPLAVLTTYSDLAKKINKEPEAQEVLEELESCVKRMSRMVNRLLALARSESKGALDRTKEPLDINQVASVVTASSVPEALKKKVELEFSSSQTPALIYADQAAIEELIGNLVENSVLYTESGGKIVVKIVKDEVSTSLIVEDEGPRIPEDKREIIFERFYRIPGTEQAGTGLGLAIVKDVATAHDATIDIQDGSDGKGTRVTVSFPKLPEQPVMKQSVTASSANLK